MGFDIGELGQGVAGSAIGAGLGLLLEGHNDRRQIRQQKALQDIQMSGQMGMMDYSQKKQMEMWEATNYASQVEQMKKAGLNPGLAYGMKGGGGVTTGNATGNTTGASAQQNPGEIQQMTGMGIMAAQQAALLKAQTENVKADTANKQAGTIKTGEEGYKLQLENVINDLFTNRDLEGNLIQDESQDKDRAAFKERAEQVKKTESEKTFKLDENKRQELLNNPEIERINQQIQLMKQQGATQEEMTNNLNKEGQIKQLELEWSKMGLTRESLTKFIQMLILKSL